MQKIIIPATIALLSLSVLPSCKKKSDDPSRTQLLMGSWKATQQGADDNTNGSWDQSEHHTISSDSTGTFTFSNNGSGTLAVTVMGMPFSQPFTWNLMNNDQDLRMIITGFGSNDTTDLNIVTIDASNLILKDASSTPNDYVQLSKQ